MFKGSKIILSFVVLSFGILIILLSLFTSGPYRDDEIQYVEGVYKEYFTTPSGKYSETGHIVLDDGREVKVSSIISGSFNEDKFLKEVQPGSTISLIVGKYSNRSTYALEIESNGIEYLNFDNAQNNETTNQNVGFILGSVFSAIGVVLLIAVFKKSRFK